MPLASWLAEIEADALVLTGDRETVARANLWSFAPTAEERARLRPHEVASFLDAVIRLWSTRVAEGWVFYAWVDEQAAGALRFSLMRGHVGDPLPFSCRVELADEPAPICTAFLAAADVIPWSSLRDVDVDVEFEVDAPRPNAAEHVLAVFVRQLGA